MKRTFVIALMCALAGAVWADDDAPRVLLDKPAKIVAYQLRRLNNGQLLAVERKTDNPKYKPVWEAILVRKSMERKFRQEAVEGLVKLNSSDPVTELLNAIGLVPEEDKATPHDLVAMLMAQPPATLQKSREKIESMGKDSDKPLVKQAAYAALATADGKPDGVWQAAAGDGLKSLLGGIPLIADGKLRSAFFEKVQPLVSKAPDAATQAAAIEAVASMPGHEADAFKLLSGVIQSGQAEARDAAIRAISHIPSSKWPKDQVGPLAKSVVDLIKKTPADQRTSPAILQAVQLGNDLAAEMPKAEGLALRKQLRELSVRVVVIHTLREQMLYDLRYFVVQAGKPVQIVLDNQDAMPHNFVIVMPGAIGEVDAAGAAIPPTGAEGEKAFVPNSPKVLQATALVQPDESATLSFTAPTQPGEYPFICTFPGHAIRMYGVMQVVPDLDAYDAAPKAPMDPNTHQPIEKQKNEATGDAPPAAHEH
jgi:uncharacterized cupredoxin-like copper-binding protein